VTNACLLSVAMPEFSADAKGEESLDMRWPGVQCRWCQLPYHCVMDKTPGKPA
jgi:hypothetical protein